MKTILNITYKTIMSYLKDNLLVSEILGIGSYFFPKKNKKPNDIDLVVKLNIPFEDKRIFKFSDELETIKDKYNNSQNTLLNIFLIDSIGRKLNSVDIWFIQYKNENLYDNIEERKNQIFYKKNKKL